MSNHSVDLLIVIALTEEADELKREQFYRLSPERSLETFSYQEFSYYDAASSQRTGILVCAGEVGQRSRDAASLFCQTFRPSLVVNVGISGRVKDARVGDVVVPTYVNSPGHRSALEDTPTGYDEIPGGQPFNVSARVLAVIRSERFRRSLKLPTVQDFAQSEPTNLSINEELQIADWQQKRLVADAAAIVDGPFAAGQPVVKSENYKHTVLGHVDRNIVAIDMESAFVAAALYNFKNPPAFFAIRAISDPANDQKSAMDQIGNGLFRRWAMANIRTTLRSLLQSSDVYAGEPDGLSRSLILERPEDDYLSEYPGQRLTREASLPDYDARFANLQIAGHPDWTFTEVVNSVRATPGGRFLVQGRGGSGKSAFLKKIQIECERDGRFETAFINVSKLIERNQNHSLADAIADKIGHLRRWNEASSGRVVIFLDELYGNEREAFVISETAKLLAAREPTIVVAFGIDHYEVSTISNGSDRIPYLYDQKYDMEIDLKNVSIHDTELALRVIGGIVNTAYQSNVPDPELALEGLRSRGFLYINHFIVSIYLNNYYKRAFKELDSTRFILRSMETVYSDLYSGSPEAFNDLCVEALRACSRSLARANVPAERNDIAERYRTTFAHFPKIVQTCLIANAIVYILRSFNALGDEIFDRVGIGPELFLSLVFTGDVNSAVKELLQDAAAEDDVLGAAQKILDRASHRGLSYALYLFGRARSVRGIATAETAMLELGPQFDLARQDSGADGRSELDEKFWRLARRSWHISRAMKDDRVATDQYIRCVLSDPYEDELNRSFHLEYYGDHRGTGVTVELDLKDSGGKWNHSRDILNARIEEMLKAGVVSEYDRICLLTYFSIVRYRHQLGKLAAAERDEAAELLRVVLGRGLPLRSDLSGFLVMIQTALRAASYDRIDAIVELFRLKGMPRYGWKSRRMATGGQIVETVAAHMFGAIFLAEMLADTAMKGITELQRYQLARLLLNHDLGEADIGDYAPTDGVTKSKERAAIQRIASLATYDGLGRIGAARGLFDEFEHGDSAIASLARDFDRLDAVFQGYIYAAKFPSVEDRDLFFKYYLDRIDNSPLLQLAGDISRRAKIVAIPGRRIGKIVKRGRRVR